MAQIHPTAVVDAGAELADDVVVGPYTVIGSEVRIGSGTRVDAHCVIEGRTTIGQGNRIFPFNSIGALPQDMSHGGEVTQLVIGDRNTIREFCTFNTGTFKEEGITRVGSDNWIMAYVHLAHDVRLGSHCVLANGVTLAGHVHVGDWATIGGLSGVLQFVHIGDHAMVGYQAHVSQDVPPFLTVDGNPLAVRAVNLVGLKRRDFSTTRQTLIRQMHKLLYRSNLPLEQAVRQIGALKGSTPDGDADVDVMLSFLAAVKRGIVR
ncbi:MAG: acyl-ACP--UDP-N-acetylglucosamine O-acyltransferase [Rubrivivax sp.]